MTLVDTHCHLDSEQFDGDRDEVINRALDGGIQRLVAIGTGEGPPDLEAGVRLAERFDAISATIGVHPHDAAKARPETMRRLEELIRHDKVVALGEIGLDYHYDFSPREVQRAIFVEQLQLAREAGKPIVIHTREAWEDTLALLQEHWPADGPGGIMHCFSGGPAEAQRVLEMGFYLAFGGIVTFPKAKEIQAAARIAPLDRLLVETDAPYLAPVPHRGKRNEPVFIQHTAAYIAGLRETTVEQIARFTTANAERLLFREAAGQ